MKITVNNISNAIIASVLFNTMTRDELRQTATVLGVPRGKSKENTIANLTAAVESGKAGLKAVCTVCHPPTATMKYSRPVFIKKLRTYKGDKVLMNAPTVS